MSAHCASSTTTTTGAVCDEPFEQQPPPGEELVARQSFAVVQADEAPDPGDEEVTLHRVVEVARKPVGHLGRDDVTGVVVGDAEAGPHHLGQRPVGDPVAVAGAATDVPEQRAGDAVCVLLELPDQPGLADAGLADDGDQPGRPAVSTVSWNIALTSANSVSRPTNAGSSPSPRRWLPRIPATTRKARHSWSGSALPFAVCSPASS